MAKRILITGASGLLGRECFKLFTEDAQWESLGLALSRAGGSTNLRKVDLTNSEQLSDVVNEFKPSVILHSAAERNPDKVEKEEERTKRLNVIATQHICSLAKEVGAYVLFISTDYVFDGTNPPYKPTDSPNPLNKYGLSKADGEKAVIQASSENIVLRVPILYGSVETIDESAVTVLLTKLKDTTSKVEVNHLQRRFPTSCADVARAIKVIVDSKFQNSEVSGFFHCSSTEMMTKYDMTMAIAEVFGLSTAHIVADTKDSSGAPRPFDCKMDTSKLAELGFTSKIPFKEGIREALKGYL